MSQIDIDRAAALDGEYDMLMELIRTRTSVRKLKPDPIPDDCVTKVLEAGRWAMSGANGQPWDFIVVKDPAIKEELFRAYSQENQEFIYWMEQQRDFKLRHPAYQMTNDETSQSRAPRSAGRRRRSSSCCSGDGRRQWATVQGAHTFGRGQTT